MTDLLQRGGGALLAMRADVASVRAFSRLREAGIPAVVLKGPAIDRWLYSRASPRTYGDVDVLVAPGCFEKACGVIEALGLSRSAFPSSSRHAEHYDPPAGSSMTAVDVHHTFHHVTAPDAICWRLLGEDAEELELATGTVLVPAEPSRAVIVALHLALHGHPATQQRMDVERAVAQASDDVWREAAERARELGAHAHVAAAVRSVPGGAELADRLGWATELTPRIALSLGGGSGISPGALTLLETPGALPKLRYLARELVPPTRQMREHQPLARRGRLGLAAAYALRPAWLLRHLPAGLGAARRAQRESRDV